MEDLVEVACGVVAFRVNFSDAHVHACVCAIMVAF